VRHYDFSLSYHGSNKTIEVLNKLIPTFIMRVQKCIRVTYLMTLPNMRFQNQTSLKYSAQKSCYDA
jgi:hypothetical protein